MTNILDNYNSLKDFFNKTKKFIKINKTSPVTLFLVTTMTEKNLMEMRLRANYSISHPIEHGMTKDDSYHPYLSDFLKQLECTSNEQQIIGAIVLNHGTVTIGAKSTFKKFIVKYSTEPYKTILFKESLDSQLVEDKAKISRMKI